MERLPSNRINALTGLYQQLGEAKKRTSWVLDIPTSLVLASQYTALVMSYQDYGYYQYYHQPLVFAAAMFSVNSIIMVNLFFGKKFSSSHQPRLEQLAQQIADIEQVRTRGKEYLPIVEGTNRLIKTISPSRIQQYLGAFNHPKKEPDDFVFDVAQYQQLIDFKETARVVFPDPNARKERMAIALQVSCEQWRARLADLALTPEQRRYAGLMIEKIDHSLPEETSFWKRLLHRIIPS